MAVHLYIVLITIIITSNSTTLGFVGLNVIIGRISQKEHLKKIDAKISLGAP